MKKIIRCLAGIVSIFMVATGLTSCSKAGTASLHDVSAAKLNFRYDKSGVSNSSELDNSQILNGFEKVTQTEYLRLYVNRETANIAIEDLRNGKVRTAIPLDINSDSVATDEMKEIMQSSLRIDYFLNEKLDTMYSYSDCVKEQKQKISAIDGGVRIDYSLNSANVSFDDLPLKISDERYKQFFVDNDKLTETDKKRTKSYFQFQSDEKIWLRTKENETVLRALYDIMQRVGYTEQELKIDCEQNDIPFKGGNKVYFNISVDYVLDNDSLIVDIPLDSLKYNVQYPPVSITCNELLLQESVEKDGYIFIPDGSGAIVEFSKNQNDIGEYTLPLYGADKTVANKQNEPKRIPALMPVYGITSNGSGVLAIIEDSDALANITVKKARTYNLYNSIGTSFDVTKSTSASIGDGSLKSLVSVFQREIYRGNIKTRYVFLNNKSDYSEMANCYREYRMLRDGINFKDNKETQLYLELIGGVSNRNSFLGVQYNGIQTLTTFEQAKIIIDKLNALGVNNIQLKYSGILEGGLENDAVSNPKLISKLGKLTELKIVNELVNQNLYLGASVLTVTSDSKGFSRYNNSAKTLDQSLSKVGSYNVVGQQQKTGDEFVIAATYLPTYVNRFIESLNSTGLSKVAFNDLGSRIYADYNKDNTVSRQLSKISNIQTIKECTDRNDGIFLEEPYIDAVSYADAVSNAPLYSNQVPIITRSVPFMSMTMSGLVSYSGEAYNKVDNRQFVWLKTIESGAMPNFSLFYEESTVLRNSNYTYLSSNNYEKWIEDAEKMYKECERLQNKINGSRIVNHEQVSEGVFRTTYQNGLSVLVNYNDKPVKIGNIVVEQVNYAIEE